MFSGRPETRSTPEPDSQPDATPAFRTARCRVPPDCRNVSSPHQHHPSPYGPALPSTRACADRAGAARRRKAQRAWEPGIFIHTSQSFILFRLNFQSKEPCSARGNNVPQPPDRESGSADFATVPTRLPAGASAVPRLFMVKPRQVRQRPALTGIHVHRFDPFATRLIHDASNLRTRDALSIQRKNGHHGIASGQRVDHLNHRRFVRRDLKLFAAVEVR